MKPCERDHVLGREFTFLQGQQEQEQHQAGEFDEDRIGRLEGVVGMEGRDDGRRERWLVGLSELGHGSMSLTLRERMMLKSARPLEVVLALFTIATDASASVAGCTVIICLSNPEGYATLPACIFPVEDFVRSVSAGGGAPD